MHSNIETTIDQILAEVVEREIVTDLEPLRTRIIKVESLPASDEAAAVESVDLTLEDSEEGADKYDDGVF